MWSKMNRDKSLLFAGRGRFGRIPPGNPTLIRQTIQDECFETFCQQQEQFPLCVSFGREIRKIRNPTPKSS
jgi:hypothetical protein